MELPKDETQKYAIEKLSEGFSAQEVAEGAFDSGYNITISQVSSLQRKYARTIAFLAADKADDLLKSVPRVNKFIRIAKLDNMGEGLEQIISIVTSQQMELIIGGSAMEARDINAYTKLVNTYLALSRLVAEETKDIAPVEKGINTYVQIIQDMPQGERERIHAKIEELKTFLSGQERTEEDIIDATFEEDDYRPQ